ncbi:Gfo/Idh/MocA family protein [Actinopolymorpha alba]|uniref:Gfo/Idh/MocA family protein n=1 Tax=Actinopolymorpha alba TaxID=533267 RepID=UPI00039AB864|nr:Gfo/Idh/MocA family oxidoreductase [Actinopolymorpha alba]
MDVRVGVIGTGIMGADHVRTLATSVSGARVTAVADIDQERARAAVAGLSGVQVHSDPMSVVQDGEVDAVLVASADSTHEKLVLSCLDAQKPVLCEKPLTPTPEGALRIIAAETSLGRRLVSVGFMRRYDPGYADVKAGLRQGVVGAPLMLHCVHRNAASRPNTPGANLITGTAVHEIDIARWLFDEEIVAVTIHRGRRSSKVVGDTPDPLLVILETESGVLVDVEVFVNAQYGYDVRCELVGESGSVSLDEPARTLLRGARSRTTGVSLDWRDRFAEAYQRELQDWVDGVVVGEQRGANAWDGYAATVVAAAGVQALKRGEPVRVHLEPRPDGYAPSSGAA